MSNELVVGNSSFNTTKNDLQDAFAACGTGMEANLMTDRMTGRPRGFGPVAVSTPEEAQKAINEMNGKSLDGREITVNIARPREEGSGGGEDAVNTGADEIATRASLISRGPILPGLNSFPC